MHLVCYQCQGSHGLECKSRSPVIVVSTYCTVHGISILIFLHVWVHDACSLSLDVYLYL